jgi:hypothetical protein
MISSYDPPGYSIADADLLTRVGIAMSLRGIPAWQTLGVAVSGGQVTLSGPVESDTERRRIVTLVSHLAGVRGVVDKTSLLEVQPRVATRTEQRFATDRSVWRLRSSAVARASLCVMLIGATVGCTDQTTSRVQTYPVSGSITLKGQPLPGAFVALHPKAPQPNVPSPRASIGPDGSLKVSTYDGGDGAPEGEYVVTVEWFKPIKSGGDLVAGPNVVPKKYSSPRTSDITIRVAAQENVLPPITL